MLEEANRWKLRSATPVLLVGDIASTIRWYRENLGFEADAFPKSPPHAFAILIRDGIQIMLQQLAGYEKSDLFGQRNGGVWNAYVRIEGVRALFRALSESGSVRVLEPLERHWYGDTEFVIQDPNGYVLVFSELEEAGRQP